MSIPLQLMRRFSIRTHMPGAVVIVLAVVVTLFLAGPDQVTLPRQMFTGIRENISPTIAAVATLLIVFTTTLMLRALRCSSS